jgi:hypothetical protein
MVRKWGSYPRWFKCKKSIEPLILLIFWLKYFVSKMEDLALQVNCIIQSTHPKATHPKTDHFRQIPCFSETP